MAININNINNQWLIIMANNTMKMKSINENNGY